MEKIIAACGNDCAACPRYVKHPYEKTADELRHTAELWMKIGYRDHIVTNEEISCTGCKPENRCRYRVIKCCADHGITACSSCREYPCGTIRECFEVTKSFMPKCREVCTDEEYPDAETEEIALTSSSNTLEDFIDSLTLELSWYHSEPYDIFLLYDDKEIHQRALSMLQNAV